jgi:glycerate kinase
VARRLGLPVIAICGSLGADAGQVRKAGIDACFSALEDIMSDAQLAQRAPGMLERCAEQVGRLLVVGCRAGTKAAGGLGY